MTRMTGQRPAKWVKLWREERGDFSRLPLLTRAFAAELLKFVDDDGRIDIGTNTTPAQELGRIMGADTRERRALVPIIKSLLDIDYITIDDGILTVSHWSKWQALGEKKSQEVASSNSSDTVTQSSVDGTHKVSRRSRNGSAMVEQWLSNGSRKSLKSLELASSEKDIEIDIDKDIYINNTVVELQCRDESRPHVNLEKDFPDLVEKNLAGVETSPVLDSVDACDPGMPPIAAPPPTQEAPKRARAKAAKAQASADVDEIFAYWKKVTGSDKSQMSDARAKRIDWAIKTYGVDECKACIDGYGSSDFHRGVNDRQTPYLDLTLWFRDETKFEAGLALSKTPSAQRIRRNRVPTTRKDFLAAAREAAQFFWDTKETLGIDSEPRNQGWNEWVYRFVHAAIVTPYRRYVCGDAIGEDVLWAAFNAELDAYEVSPVEIHPGILEKRIAASVDEWKAARIFAVDSDQEQANQGAQA